MPRSNCTSRENKRFPDFVAFPLQVGTRPVEFHVDEVFNIFTNNPARLDGGNDASHFWPEITRVVGTSLFTGV